jgi:L-fuculose-phosphate aldolase
LLLQAEREELCSYGRLIVETGLVVGTSGNLSVRKDNLVAVTASGAHLERMEPRDCTVVDLDGHLVDGDRPPSSEAPLHLSLYNSSDAAAIVHTHAVFSATVATTLPALPAIHYNVLLLGGHDVRVARYATYGTDELAASVTQALAGGRTAALMANHGGVTLGSSLAEAFERTRVLEWLCEVYVRSLSIGTPRILTPAELDAVAARMA